MQAFVPCTQVEYPVGSALSEPLIVDTIGEGKYFKYCMYQKQCLNKDIVKWKRCSRNEPPYLY